MCTCRPPVSCYCFHPTSSSLLNTSSRCSYLKTHHSLTLRLRRWYLRFPFLRRRPPVDLDTEKLRKKLQSRPCPFFIFIFEFSGSSGFVSSIGKSLLTKVQIDHYQDPTRCLRKVLSEFCAFSIPFCYDSRGPVKTLHSPPSFFSTSTFTTIAYVFCKTLFIGLQDRFQILTKTRQFGSN
ncbi:hypothetical protein LXL04_024545 [Taraxacum kok-saghyz]